MLWLSKLTIYRRFDKEIIMDINWNEVQKAILPNKDYEALCKRWQESFAYEFVRNTFNATIPQLSNYTRLGIGDDPKERYKQYTAILINTFNSLDQAGVKDLLDLLQHTKNRSCLEELSTRSKIPAQDIARVLSYLGYWFIPSKKPLSSLMRNESPIMSYIKLFNAIGIKSNLDALQAGLTQADRQGLAKSSGLPIEIVNELINRADFSRMPWSSKATISNLVGAGYGSFAKLVNANPDKLFNDYYKYGQSIGRNLKLGNEIENCYRIAKLLPVILRD